MVLRWLVTQKEKSTTLWLKALQLGLMPSIH